MVPQKILDGLARVRARERMLRLAWGAARTLALTAGAMLLACLIDWLVDLRTETPSTLRGFLLLAQVALWAGAAGVLIVGPLLKRLDDGDTALWVEGRFPEFGHRLITAVELNRPGAPIDGMSPELLAEVTRQAEERAGRTDFTSRFDSTRLKRSAAIAAAVAAVLAIFALAAPETTVALLARQFLADREIPRSVAVEAEVPSQVRPSGEEVKLRFRATGEVAFESIGGSVEIRPEGRPSEDYPLVFESKDGKGGAVFAASIPPGSVDFGYRARLRDGRTRKPAIVDYEPRPVVQKIDAWVLLPRYCGERPDGSPYEQYRVRGEIAGPLGSSARVVIGAQKQIVRGSVELLGRAVETAPESLLRSVDLVLRKDGTEAVAVFYLRAGELAYRIGVEDKHGFANATPPKRGIAIMPAEPPRVVLLPARLSDQGDPALSDDTEVDGMPIPIGGPIQIGYYCAHPYGIDRARLGWRVIKAAKVAEEGGASGSDVPWQYLPLGEVRATFEAGAFDLRRGHFEKTGVYDGVEFYPLPSPDPERIHGRTEGGGRFYFQTKPLAGLQAGDQIELFVEVFARNPALAKLPGRSETRVKAFVTQAQFREWWLQALKYENRLRQLESRQRGVFTPEGDR